MEALQFVAIMLIVASLVPGGAHLLELPNKMALDRERYFTVQQIYRGWALAAVPLLGALLSTLALAVLSRAQWLPFLFSTASFLLLLVTLVAFFIWIYPTNRATDDWTTAPDGWRALRSRWEYTHAVNAVITLAALASALLAVLTWSGT